MSLPKHTPKRLLSDKKRALVHLLPGRLIAAYFLCAADTIQVNSGLNLMISLLDTDARLKIFAAIEDRTGKDTASAA